VTEPGELLNGRYRVREVLTGGMGQILICDWAGGEAESADPPADRVALKRSSGGTSSTTPRGSRSSARPRRGWGSRTCRTSCR
jgi:hypothetical protein